MFDRRRPQLAAMLCVSAIVSCVGGGDWSLSRAGDPSDPRVERLRRQLDVRVEDGDVDGCDPLPDGASSCTPAAFVALVVSGCESSPTGTWSAGACATSARDAYRFTCDAEALLRVVQGQGVDVAVGSNGATISVGPQDLPTQAELSRLAVAIASLAGFKSTEALASTTMCPSVTLQADAGTGGPLDDISLGEMLADTSAHSYVLMRDASREAARASMGTADSQQATAPDQATAEFVELADFASRAAAAHMILGGAHGLPALHGVDSTGFFPRPRLSADGQVALAYLRLAAISPASILNKDLSIDELMFSQVSQSALAQSVHGRLAFMIPQPELFDVSTASAVYRELDLTRDAFVEAREYLAFELRAFDRSPVHRLPWQGLPSGETTDAATVPSGPHATKILNLELYASVRNPPTARSRVWWTSVLRYRPEYSMKDSVTEPDWDWSALSSFPEGFLYGEEYSAGAGTAPVSGEYAGSSLAADLEIFTTRASAAAQRLSSETDPTLVSARESLGLLLVEIGSGSVVDPSSTAPAGHARACVRGDATTGDPLVRIDLGLHEEVERDDVIIVTTHDALDCAISGAIEGVQCTAADIAVSGVDYSLVASSLPEADAARLEFDVAQANWETQTYLQGSAAQRPTAHALSVYVLRLRKGGLEGQPGSYVAIAGWILPEPSNPTSSKWEYCDNLSINPGLEEWAREIIAPNPDYPGDSFTSCAGIDGNFRLPLENELTDDGNGVESSWRHYLTIAHAAADEADALGEAVVQAGLELDLRSESAIDELQEICGVTLNVSPFQALDRTEETSDACSMGYFRPRPEDMADVCVLDPVAYALANAQHAADRAQLASCLGALGDSTDFVGLGDQNLCLWDVDGAFCSQEEDAPRRTCPFSIGTQTSCPSTSDADYFPPGATDHAVTTTLGLFQMPAEEDQSDTIPTPEEFPCGAMARMRSRPGLSALLDYAAVLRSGFLTYSQFSEAARNLRFEATAGDFVNVYYGNTLVFSTRGTGHWPMAAAPVDVRPLCDASDCFSSSTASASITELATYDGPLFAIPAMAGVAGGSGTESGASDARRLRARLDDLLGRAVVAAHVLGGAPLQGARIPYYHPAIYALQFGGGAFSLIGAGSSVYQSDVGSLLIDLAYNDLGDPPWQSIDAWSATVQAVNGAPEWLHCDYTSTGACTVFDAPNSVQSTGESPVDGTGLQLPLFLRTLAAGVDREGVDARTASLWGEGSVRRRTASVPVFRVLIGSSGVSTLSAVGQTELSTLDGPVRLSDLSNYFADDYRANQAYIGAGAGISDRDVMNALELTCLAARLDAGHPDPITHGCDEPMAFSRIGDVLDGAEYLECVANRAQETGATSVLRGLPESVVDAVRRGGGVVDGGAAGELNAQVLEIQAALVELRDEQYGIAADIRTYANAVSEARNVVRSYEIGAEIREVELQASLANAVTECIVSAANEASKAAAAGFAAGVSAAAGTVATMATCTNGMLQQTFRARIAGLEDQRGALEIQNALASADDAFVRSSASIRSHAIAISAAIARINAALSRMRAAQARARDALARALFLDSPESARHFAVDSALHGRYNLALARYRESWQRAIRLAYIARLALEQRLAVHLSDMTEDLVSVDAPSRWADGLCGMTPIDYEALRASSDPEATLLTPDGYSGVTIGDYVDRLEQVFESYSFAHPFQDGTDTVVVSLRDDVFHLTRACEVEVPNLLYHASALDDRSHADRIGWDPRACDEEQQDAFCTVVSRPGLTLPAQEWGDRLGAPSVTQITFGGQAVSTTRLSQDIALGAGRYRLSWYAHDIDDADPSNQIDPAGALRLVGGDGVPLPLVNDGGVPIARALAGDWARYDYYVDVGARVDLEVAVIPDAATVEGATILVAGVQLTRASASASGDVDRIVPGGAATLAEAVGPGAFFGTDGSRIQLVDGCADDGTELRRRVFSRTCVPVCAAGAGACSRDETSSRCAWQTTVDVTSDRLERLLSGQSTGFASGNFNYRFETVAVNLVGSGLRDCSADGRSGCYSSGNATFSLLHQGPFVVRDYDGRRYLSPLFLGRIESARALAAERYLTNPMSGADTALVQPYVRSELRGRPLGGNVILQIWDDSTFAFNRLEDVQLSITYRYWQRQR